MHQLQLTCAALSIWSWVWALSSSSSFCSLLHFALHCRRASWALVFSSSLVLWLSWSKASFSFLSTCSLLWKKQDPWTLRSQGLIVSQYWPVGVQHRPLALPAFAAAAPSVPGPRTVSGAQEERVKGRTCVCLLQLWDGAKQKTRAERELKRREKLLLQLDQEEAAKRKSCSCVFCCLTVIVSSCKESDLSLAFFPPAKAS